MLTNVNWVRTTVMQKQLVRTQWALLFALAMQATMETEEHVFRPKMVVICYLIQINLE